MNLGQDMTQDMTQDTTQVEAQDMYQRILNFCIIVPRNKQEIGKSSQTSGTSMKSRGKDVSSYEKKAADRH